MEQLYINRIKPSKFYVLVYNQITDTFVKKKIVIRITTLNMAANLHASTLRLTQWTPFTPHIRTLVSSETAANLTAANSLSWPVMKPPPPTHKNIQIFVQYSEGYVLWLVFIWIFGIKVIDRKIKTEKQTNIKYLNIYFLPREKSIL